MARLPAEYAGLALRWGLSLYADGRPVDVDQARREARLDDRQWAIAMDVMTTVVDQDRLAEGVVVVIPFREAMETRDRVGAARVRERASPVSEARPERRAVNAAAAPVVDDQRDAMVATLLAKRVGPDDAEAAVSRWIEAHGRQPVVDAIAGLSGRSVSRPVAYVDRVLENDRAQRHADMPSSIRLANRGTVLPRPVPRRVRVGARAAWEMLGYTAKGHRRDGGAREARMEVWRTDAGTLAYQKPADVSAIPDYDRDPGVYEHE